MSTVTLAVLTYRRPAEVVRCLRSINDALCIPLPSPWRIAETMVIDNDPGASARATIESLRANQAGSLSALGPILYLHEERSGVAWARNRALDEANGSTLVFIDDDETAEDGWPHGLLETMSATGAAMVGGPVLTEFEVEPPQWITAGRFFERQDPEHASSTHWLRSGNLAIDLKQIRTIDLRFDPRYQHGEDAAFSMEGARQGLDLRWSANGSVTESVGPERLSARWRIRRERISHQAWSTTLLDLDPGPKTTIRILARSAHLVARGLCRILAGSTTGNRARAVAGVSDWAAVVGRIQAVASYLR